jgi:micrococcal nuclease
MRHLARAATVLLIIFTGATAVQAAETTVASAAVTNVVDGDTIDVRLDDGRTERIRAIGIDTPEVVDSRTPVQCFAREASAYAHALLDGQVVSIELDPSQGDRDTYGRLLAYLWLPDGRNFGEVMIADGFAHEYTYDLPYASQGAFKVAQEQAMANQVGLWSPATCSGDTTQPAEVPVVAEKPAPAPTPAPPAAKPAATVRPIYSGRYDPFGPDRDCGDFRTQAEAQAFFVAAGGPGSDRHRLDGDRDGVVCETLR